MGFITAFHTLSKEGTHCVSCARTEGPNSLVDQDLIGVCHMHTYVHRKIHRHLNSHVHTRNTVNSSDKIAFSDSLRHQWVGCFTQCDLLKFRTTILPCHHRHVCTVSLFLDVVGPVSKSSLLETFQGWVCVFSEKELVP